MRLIPFGAFQAMLGILFAMTVVLALLATASGKSFQGSSTMLAILLLGLQRAEVVTWWADSFREGGGRRMRWTDCLLACPSVSFDCPQRESGGAGVHKWQRREDERVRTPFWTFVRRLSFWQTPTSDDDRPAGRGAGSDRHSFGSFS